jgi:hypothetical protein
MAVWLGWVAFTYRAPPPPVPAVPEPALPTLTVWLSYYTCEYDTRNAMATTPGSCIATRTGADPHRPGAACPAAWTAEGREVYIPGHGWLTCDDTGRWDYWGGDPHIDVRLSGAGSYAEAIRRGAYHAEIMTR